MTRPSFREQAVEVRHAAGKSFTKYIPVYQPKTGSRIAEIVAQVMEAEEVTVAELAEKAAYAKQSIYAAFSDDRTGKRSFRFAFAVRLLDALGYRLEFRAVKK